MQRTVHETSGPRTGRCAPTVLLLVHLSRPTRVWSHFSSRPSRDVERSVVGERASVGSRRSVSCLRGGRMAASTQAATANLRNTLTGMFTTERNGTALGRGLVEVMVQYLLETLMIRERRGSATHCT